MDTRHESLKEGMLNHIITTVNAYIQSNTDTLVTNPVMRSTLQDICRRIYAYLGVNVDVSDILSKKNLLSIDTVMLPIIPDPEGNRILNDTGFMMLMKEIENHIHKLKDSHSGDGLLRKNLSEIVDEYKNLLS